VLCTAAPVMRVTVRSFFIAGEDVNASVSSSRSDAIIPTPFSICGKPWYASLSGIGTPALR